MEDKKTAEKTPPVELSIRRVQISALSAFGSNYKGNIFAKLYTSPIRSNNRIKPEDFC